MHGFKKNSTEIHIVDGDLEMRMIAALAEGTALYKICPKCSDTHIECNNQCSWFGVENPCTIAHFDYPLMIVPKKFHDGWRIKDLAMIGEKYFLTEKEALLECERIGR